MVARQHGTEFVRIRARLRNWKRCSRRLGTVKEISTTRLRPGYELEQVDASLEAIRDTFLGVREPPLTADEVRNKQFSTTRLRPGYEEEVDAFFTEVELRLAVLPRPTVN